MKEKSQIEKKAEEKQTELLSAALGGASNAGGHWLNVSGKGFPRLYPQGVSASPFNALFMALHSDNNGCKTNLFTLYSETKARGLRYGSMSRAYRSCSITGTSMSTGTIRMKPSTVPPISNWTKSRRHSSRVSTTEKSARFSISTRRRCPTWTSRLTRMR